MPKSFFSIKSIVLRLKYPPLWLLLLLIFSSLFVFTFPSALEFVKPLHSNECLSVFFAGILFAVGILTPFCAAFLINFPVQNIFLCGLIGAIGAMIVDLIFFEVLRVLFKSDFEDSKEKQLIKFSGFFSNNWFGKKIVNYASFALAGWIVAAPLPNDMGKKLVAILSKLSRIELAIISFCVNAIGITFFLWL